MAIDALTLDDLRGLLLEAAGEPQDFDLNGEIDDVPFEEMGYDSIALLETSGRIERLLGVSLGDGIVAEAPTPRALLDIVNETLTTREVA